MNLREESGKNLHVNGGYSILPGAYQQCTFGIRVINLGQKGMGDSCGSLGDLLLVKGLLLIRND